MRKTTILALLLATPLAAADEPTADDVAVLAAEVHQEHCADIYGDSVDLAAEGYTAVAPVWQQVNQVYDEGQQPFLLYWRGLLAACLGQRDASMDDLQAFIAAEGENKDLDAMVGDAQRRMTRIRMAQLQEAAGRTMGPHEARRFVRSGLSPAEWRARRHSMGQRVVLLVGMGILYGAHKTEHTQAVASDGSWVAVDWLSSEIYFHAQFGVEAWPGGAIGIGAVFDVTTGELYNDVVAVDDLADVTIPDDQWSTLGNPWIGTTIWVATTPLPRKPVKPLIRLGPRFRFTSAQDPGGAVAGSKAWAMASMGAFAGVAYHPRTVVGVEFGAWVFHDLTSGNELSGDVEAAPASLTTRGDDPSRWSIDFMVLVRFGL